MNKDKLSRAIQLSNHIGILESINDLLDKEMSSTGFQELESTLMIERREILEIPAEVYYKILPQLKDMLSVELSKLEKEFEEL